MKTILWTSLLITAVTVNCSNVKPEPSDSQLNLSEISSKMSEEETAHNPWNFIEERKVCLPTISCTHAGGHCVNSNSDCNGIIDRYGCRGRKYKCKCCIPDLSDNTTPAPTCPATVTCPPCNTTGTPTIDDLATHELWLHILLQLDRPYEDRNTTYRGDNNNIYYLDNENHDPNSTPIIIPTMDDFTSGKGRFDKLFNYPKGRGVIPSMFEPDVKSAVHELYTVYKEHPGAKGILKVAVNGKDHVNEYLHMHTLMHAIIYDKELHGYGLPAFYDVFPEFFTKGCNAPSPQCCQIDEYPHDLTEDEWKLSYWREEAANNNFHGSWHFYNPWHHTTHVPLIHGELYYYFHNQLVARYNMERLSNELKPVTPLDNWNSSYLIPQNYIPPVLTHPNYFSLTRCADMSAGPLAERVGTFRKTLEKAISNNKLMLSNGSYVDIRNDDGIKYVGCALERANCGDINITLYGGPSPHDTYGIHYNGHDVISSMGCESGVLETNPPYNVLGSAWPSIRDPLFFRWHKFIDDVFQSHKANLPEYQLPKLALNGVSVKSIGVHSTKKEGELHTFNSKLKMTMWFNATTETCVDQITANHHPFTYNINVVNNNATDIDVNVRIYMAPKLDPELSYEELRTSWALMDLFKQTLHKGDNLIVRDSCNSSITIPRPKSIGELSDIYKDEESFNNFISKPATCQCGLPEHLLIPRGTHKGMPYQLFVYITPRNKGQRQSSRCDNLECGVLCNRDYTDCLQSDNEPMGFPFDRPLNTLGGVHINYIQNLTNELTNAMLHDIKIIYNKDVQKNTRQCSD